MACSQAHDIALLLERQKELEGSSVARGVDRFRQRLLQAEQSGRASAVGAARRLVAEGIEPLSLTLQAMIEDKRRGPKHQLHRWVQIIGYEPMAYITIKTVLDMVSGVKPATLRSVALELSDRLVHEARYTRFQEMAPELFEYRMKNFSTSNTKHMAKSLDQAMRYKKIDTDDLDMAQNVRLIVGVKLIDLLISSTGLVDHTEAVAKRVGKQIRRDKYLIATPDTLKWMKDRNSAMEALYPVYMPMIVPPMQWRQGRRGGYRFALYGKHPLTRGTSKAHRCTVDAATMPVVYDALNRIQETPWRINAKVLDVVQQIVNSGVSMAGIPEHAKIPMPSKPVDIASNEEARKAWKKRAHAVHNANHMRKLRVMDFQKTLTVALAMRDEAAIYFPCNLDFRGRVYPVTNYLNPQGDDLSKGLLSFADGKPLGEHGAKWLALHGANCLGETPDGIKLSKQTLQSRVDCMVRLTNLAERIAADPLSNREWCAPHVDEPLQYLAFCFEWAGFAKLHREGNGASYVCSLPVAMDGTCNGLQHFSAMLRDAVGGAAVNVVPQAGPQDIYQRVADYVLGRLEADAGREEMARLWLTSGLVNRKLAKRPTMTFGYGSKKFGFRQQLIDDVRTRDEWRELKPLFCPEGSKGKYGNLPAACGYMSKLIWDALQVTVVAAAQGMQWMQESARVVVGTGKCVEWSTPVTGFPVRQEYMMQSQAQVKTILQGTAFWPCTYENTAQPNFIKQGNAVAPNVVHSLDAAALMLTVEKAAEMGVTHFGMVHDSYGTLAADAEYLAAATRESFVTLYDEHDVIAELAAQWSLQTDGEEIPEAPAKGSLDVKSVRDSEYFFA